MGNEKRRTIKLSVIIPCLNAEATLATQLEALAAQQWSEPWELVISDNGSTDDSIKIAHQFENRFLKLRVVDSSDRRGGAHAVNVGIRAAAAEAVVCCDADDEVVPGWVASMGDALQKNDVVYGQFYFDKFNDPNQARKSAQAWKDGLYKGRFLPGGGSGNLGIRRWVHDAIGGFEEILLHAYDADYYWRLQLEGFKLGYVPEAGIQVRIGRVNPSLKYLFRRGIYRTTSNYWLYKRYRHLGMLPPESTKESFKKWIHMLKPLAYAFPKRSKNRAVILQRFVQQTGELMGQLQGRITNPFRPYHPGNKVVAS